MHQTLTVPSQHAQSKPRRKARKIWHYTPDLPIGPAPYARWPVDLRRGAMFFAKAWNPLTERFLVLVAAVVIWSFFTPSLERTATFQFDWMAEVFARNSILVFTLVGGLHLWLFTFRGQNDDTHYDARPLATKSKIFLFGNQVWDNMFWTMASTVPIGTLWECLMLWAMANGHVTLISWSESPVYATLLLAVIPIWAAWHFYAVHRVLHIPWLYRKVHYVHHKNVNTGPWSGHAMHPVEAAGIYSDGLLYFFVACHPVHVIFNILLHTISGPISHSGFESVRIGRFRLRVGDFMHQLHHRFIDCNYGTSEAPWDSIAGSWHDGTSEGDQRINERRRKMMAAQAKTTPAE